MTFRTICPRCNDDWPTDFVFCPRDGNRLRGPAKASDPAPALVFRTARFGPLSARRLLALEAGALLLVAAAVLGAALAWPGLLLLACAVATLWAVGDRAGAKTPARRVRAVRKAA